MIPRGDHAKAALTGLGLAFGLGWLWFPWLAAAWLPGLLWGDSASGGGGAFLLLLVLGFGPGGIILARILAAKNGGNGIARQTLFANGRRICHIAAYILLLAALFLRLDGPRNMPGIWPYIAMPAAVAAYAAMGLYWGSRILLLPPFLSVLAFFAAAAVAAVAGQALSLLPMKTALLLWPHSVVIAAVLAEILARMEAPPPKSRGRPPKKESEPACPPLCFGGKESSGASPSAMAMLVAVLAGIGFIDGGVWTLHSGQIAAPSAWLAGVSFCSGTAVPALLIARLVDPHVRGLWAALVVTLGTAGAALAAAWSPFAGGLAQCFVEGTVSAVGLCLLANEGADKGAAVRRAGLMLAACVAAVNAGRLAGDAVAATTGILVAIIPAAAACMVLIRVPLGAAIHALGGNGAKRLSSPGASLNGESGAFYENDDGFLSCFTSEETRIVKLLMREGLSNQEIANRLFVTRSTVRYHLKKIYTKTKTSNREELAKYLVREFGQPGGNHPEKTHYPEWH